MSERPPISPRSPRAALEPERVPPPPKRSERARNPLVVIGNAIITIVLVLMIGAGAAYYYGQQKIEAPGPLQEDKIVNVPAKAGMADIADTLQREGVIENNRWAFIGAVLALKARSELKPGEYLFQKNASLHDVIGTMVDGKVVQHSVTIPEGLTSQQIVTRLLADEVLTGDVKEIPPEGSLLPDTYKFTRGMTREQMIHHMQEAQERAVQEIWDHRAADLPLKTPEQAVSNAMRLVKAGAEFVKAEGGREILPLFQIQTSWLLHAFSVPAPQSAHRAARASAPLLLPNRLPAESSHNPPRPLRQGSCRSALPRFGA